MNNITISKNQLETWENLGAQQSSKDTYQLISNLLKNDSKLNNFSFDIYLQGSYVNNTNIYGDSDVDIIVCLNSIYTRDISNLSKEEEELFFNDFVPATITLHDFKTVVINVLKSRYNVEIDNKCLKISGTPLDTDIVVCNDYRIYNSYSQFNKRDYIEGIIFYSNSGDEIISFPKLHKNNGTNKNNLANGNFKKSVRIFKNMKSNLMKDTIISEKTAPSYFIECLLYNVPKDKFVNNVNERVYNILVWLENIRNTNGFKELLSQNNVVYLFGESDQQWDIINAKLFINSLINLWNGD